MKYLFYLCVTLFYFPGVVIPITAGRDKSIQLIKDANKADKIVGVVAQKNGNTEDPGLEDIYTTGVVAQILKVLKMPDGNTTVIIQGKKRFEIDEITQETPYLKAKVHEAKDERDIDDEKEFEAIIESIKELALEVIKENPMLPSEASMAIKNIQSNSFLVNFISSNMELSVAQKQVLLEKDNLKERALLTLKNLDKELQKLQLRNDIQSKTRSDLDKQQRVIKENPMLPSEASMAIKNIQSNSFLVNFISSNMELSVAQKQVLLEKDNLKERALLTLKNLDKELQKLQLRNDIQSKTRSDLDKQQREYYLHQQLKTIQEELGGVSHDQELEEMRAKAKDKKWNKEVAETFEKEINRLKRMNPQMAEYGVQRNYLELMLELPWGVYSEDKFDLKKAQQILDRDHFGLEKVKDRIIEHLAVLKLRGDMKSPIICLYGPPGVGKTSLGKSVAEALGRKYVRMSLGGLRDEGRNSRT